MLDYVGCTPAGGIYVVPCVPNTWAAGGGKAPANVIKILVFCLPLRGC